MMNDKFNPSITIFMPAFNEQETIRDVVVEAQDVLQKMSSGSEIIVVNDGSEDRTGEILDELSAKIPTLKVIHHIHNQGIARAMMRGYSEAKGDLIFFNSADKQGPMSYLFKMLEKMDELDLVVGCFPERKDSQIRLFCSKIYHLLVRILFEVKLHNVNALKLFKREIFVKSNKLGNSLCIDTELIVRAKRNGYRVGEIPLEHYPRDKGQTKVIGIGKTMHTFMNLFILFFKIRCESINLIRLNKRDV